MALGVYQFSNVWDLIWSVGERSVGFGVRIPLRQEKVQKSPCTLWDLTRRPTLGKYYYK